MKKFHFVTLFDSGFLHQGLALYKSLDDTLLGYCLWIVCLDNDCFDQLSTLDLKNARLINFQDMITDELLQLQLTRKRNEFCWTLTPYSISWIFDLCSTCSTVTYLDADLFILKDPSYFLDEFQCSDFDVLITEHGYSPDYDQTKTAGRYCVQFLSFKRTGLDILDWWRKSCLVWCHDRHEDGLFGDQRYFEYLPSSWVKRLHSLPGRYFQAPWNAEANSFSEAYTYHFHGFYMIKPGLFFCSSYRIPKPTLVYVYMRYIESLIKTADMLRLSLTIKSNCPHFAYLLLLRLKKIIAYRLVGINVPPYYIKVKAINGQSRLSLL